MTLQVRSSADGGLSVAKDGLVVGSGGRFGYLGLWLCSEEFEGGSAVLPKTDSVCVFCLRENQKGKGSLL